MKLNTKITLSLVLGLSSIMAVAQTLQYLDQTRRITQQTQTEIQALESQAERNARSIYDSVQMAGSLEQGEMEKFTMMLQKQKNVKGLVEYSLYDRQGVVTHSSDAKFLGKAMSDAQKKDLFSKHDEQVTKTDESIEIYKPIAINGDCIRCHMDWPATGIGGVTYFKYSTQELADAKAGAETMLSQVETAMLRNGVLALVGLVIVISLLSTLLVGRPLKAFFAMLKPLETDSKNLTYQIPVDRTDEIGKMAETFNVFTGNLNGVIGEAQQIGKRVGTEASRQAATVEETSSEMQEIASQTKQNAGNAEKANQMMNEIRHQMSRGQHGHARPGDDHAGNFAGQQQNRLHRQDHRRNRLADQPVGAQRRRGSGPRRRSGKGIFGRRRRRSETGHGMRRGRPEYQPVDRRHHQQGPKGRTVRRHNQQGIRIAGGTEYRAIQTRR